MEVSGKPSVPLGKYQNVFYSESEYAELKEEYPDRLERLEKLFERTSCLLLHLQISLYSVGYRGTMRCKDFCGRA